MSLSAAAYLDQRYWRDDGEIVAERSFVLFLNAVAKHFERFVLLGRLAPPPARGDYRVEPPVEFVELPGYSSGARAGEVLRVLPASLATVWRTLDGVDVLWALGPSAPAIAFVAAAAAHRRPVVLGVRQQLRRYARNRHPGRRAVHAAADALEAAFRLAARRRGTVVVGPELARDYRRSPALLETTVSLVPAASIVSAADAARRSYDGPQLTVLSVGRLDPEKNPLLLADALAALRRSDPRWRMVVCGDGPLRGALEARLAELRVSSHADVRGHVALEPDLAALYREAHALLHVSWTEGVPQVLFEAFAAGLPVVATDVGGVSGASDGAAELIPAGDAHAAAAAVAGIARDGARRAALVDAGLELAARHTLEAEAATVAAFIAAQAGRR